MAPWFYDFAGTIWLLHPSSDRRTLAKVPYVSIKYFLLRLRGVTTMLPIKESHVQGIWCSFDAILDGSVSTQEQSDTKRVRRERNGGKVLIGCSRCP